MHRIAFSPRFSTFLALILCLASEISLAESETLSVGMTLPEKQVSQISGRELLVHGKPLKVVSTAQGNRLKQATETAESSFVINDRGQVGRSLNEIIITRVSAEQVQQAVSALKTAPASIRHYEHLNSSSLRFATFEQAVAAQTQMKSLLPQAAVALPIEYHRRNLR